MSEATDAIVDINEGLEEFGSSIILKKVVQGVYNPSTGSTTDTVTEIPLKAFISNLATPNQVQAISPVSSSYDFVFKTYHTEVPTKDWLVEFEGDEYQILLVDKTVIQSEVILLELVAKK